MKVATIADFHLGDTTHDTDGWRIAEASHIALEIAQSCLIHDVGVVVFAGDTFHAQRPQPWAYRTLAVLAEDLRANGIRVRIFAGNHDADPPDGVGPLSAGLFAGNEYITRPFVENIDGANIVYLPWASRAQIAALRPRMSAGEQHGVMATVLKSVLDGLLIPDAPTLLVTHFTIAGMAYNSGVQPALGDSSELMLPRDTFAADRFDMVISGHIHKPQVLTEIDGVSPVAYPGSVICHDFGEEAERKGFLIWESQLNALEQISVSATPFQTFEVALKGGEYTLSPDPMLAAGSVCRLKGTLPAGALTAGALSRFRDELIAAGAIKVAKPAITFERHENRTVSTITTASHPVDVFGEYAESVGGDYVGEDGHARVDLLKAHRAQIKEVEDVCAD